MIDQIIDGDTRISEMRRAREVDAVVLQEYNAFRSKHAGINVFAVEGYDDVIFYDVMASRSGIEGGYESFICHGKDRVLGLRRMLARNLSPNAKDVYFFVDRDFDDLKGEEPSANLHCTTVYSIENYLACTATLTNLLKSDFRCAHVGDEENRERVKSFFRSAFDEFVSAMREVNFCLYMLRSQAIYAKSVENDLHQYIKISEATIKPIITRAKIITLVGGDGHVGEDIFTEPPAGIREKFDSFDPALHWRGKFNLQFFCIILKILKEDRGRKSPNIFINRKTINLEFGGNMMRYLSSACEVPETLREFYKNLKEPESG